MWTQEWLANTVLYTTCGRPFDGTRLMQWFRDMWLQRCGILPHILWIWRVSLPASPAYQVGWNEIFHGFSFLMLSFTQLFMNLDSDQKARHNRVASKNFRSLPKEVCRTACLSFEQWKKAWLLIDMGSILPSYVGIIVNHKDPSETASIVESKRAFLVAHLFSFQVNSADVNLRPSTSSGGSEKVRQSERLRQEPLPPEGEVQRRAAATEAWGWVVPGHLAHGMNLGHISIDTWSTSVWCQAIGALCHLASKHPENKLRIFDPWSCQCIRGSGITLNLFVWRTARISRNAAGFQTRYTRLARKSCEDMKQCWLGSADGFF